MKHMLLLMLLALAGCVSPEPQKQPHKMNLTDLANHICEQCGMNDTDDVSAAKMFLQRRLEMIWNTQLWRASLIEATLTVNPDGTCSLGNTIWIPSRSTLLLPPEFDSVLAVRADNHSMNVASLESYYRTDTDWLDMQGDPTEFQVLRPAVWEFSTPINLVAIGTSSLTYSITPDGITTESGNLTTVSTGLLLGLTQVIWKASGSVNAKMAPDIQTTINASSFLIQGNFVQANIYASVDGNTLGELVVQYDQGSNLTINKQVLPYGTRFLIPIYDGLTQPAVVIPFFTQSVTFDQNYGLTGTIGITSATPNFFLSYTASQNALPSRQRIRLTTQPQLSTNLRILGKTSCPVLGDYDEAPINNVEPCLMAFARGDMLLRQRQNGKAQLAQQEGATLLSQLARSEAFQTANSFRIVPDNGFGGDNVISQPNSLHPL